MSGKATATADDLLQRIGTQQDRLIAAVQDSVELLQMAAELARLEWSADPDSASTTGWQRTSAAAWARLQSYTPDAADHFGALVEKLERINLRELLNFYTDARTVGYNQARQQAEEERDDRPRFDDPDFVDLVTALLADQLQNWLTLSPRPRTDAEMVEWLREHPADFRESIRTGIRILDNPEKKWPSFARDYRGRLRELRKGSSQ